MKRMCFVVLFFALFAIASGQESNWHTYRSGGYPTDMVYGNHELWISSGAGILRWDMISGQKTQYDISNAPAQIASISCLLLDSNGNLWGGGYYGVVKYNGISWQYYDSNNTILSNQTIRCIEEDHAGAIWMTSSGAVYKYDNGIWSVYNSSNSNLPVSLEVMDLAVDQQNRIWICGYNGVWCYNGTSWIAYTYSNSTLPNYSIYTIEFEESGVGWFGGSNGVARYANGVWEHQANINGVSMYDMRDVYLDSMQRVWFCTTDDLLGFDGSTYYHYPISLFASYSQSFSSLVVDDDMNLWIRMFDTYSPLSLVKYDGMEATRYPVCELPLPSKYVQAIFKGLDNKLWVGTSNDSNIGGYISIQGDEVETFGMYNTDMPCDHVWALAQDNLFNMWVSTCLGLLRTGPSGSHVYQSGETGMSVYALKAICPVGDGVWIGGNSGVSRFQNGVWTVLSSTEAGMSLANTKAIKMDPEGGIWIGCAAGVCCYRNGEFITYTLLTNANDFAFGEDGTVWVARGTLSVFQNGLLYSFDTTNSALLANHIGCVAVDGNNKLWAGSFWPDCVLYSYADGAWSVYNSGNSPLAGSGINKIYVDEENTKWIGTNDLVLFNESGFPTANEEQLAPMPLAVSNYPNPFFASTNIRFTRETDGPTIINIYNIKGQKVWSTRNDRSARGQMETLWNGKDLSGRDCAAGIYLIEVRDKYRNTTHKALKLK